MPITALSHRFLVIA